MRAFRTKVTKHTETFFCESQIFQRSYINIKYLRPKLYFSSTEIIYFLWGLGLVCYRHRKSEIFFRANIIYNKSSYAHIYKLFTQIIPNKYFSTQFCT